MLEQRASDHEKPKLLIEGEKMSDDSYHLSRNRMLQTAATPLKVYNCTDLGDVVVNSYSGYYCHGKLDLKKRLKINLSAWHALNIVSLA